MKNSTVALVTGANQGIGFEIARGLLAEGFTVLVGSRSFERGVEAASKLGEGAVALQLDVTDQASVTAAAICIRNEFDRLDVLVQNAGIATAGDRTFDSGEELAAANRPSTVSLDEMRKVWDTNVFGVLAVYQAMLPILRKTPNACIVNVSSGMGSLTLNSDPDFPLRPLFDASYSASKTALNALTLAMAIELENENICVNAISPGHTRTRLTGFSGTDTPEQGAAEAVRVALQRSEGPSGKFTHATMGNLPW